MRKSQIITILIVIVVALLVVVLLLLGSGKVALSPTEIIPSDISIEEKLALEILGNKEDLVSFSIKPGDGLNYPVEVIGIVKGGYFFEGNIQINILDKDKNILRSGYGTAITDWMTAGPVSFKTTINVTELPNAYGGFAYIEIKKDNPSDNRGLDKSILIPVYIM